MGAEAGRGARPAQRRRRGLRLQRGLVILFGGAGADGFAGDTWSWDRTTWKKLADTGSEPRAMGYLE
jgi:hypothetical protein